MRDGRPDALRLGDLLGAAELDALAGLASRRGCSVEELLIEVLAPYTRSPTTRAAEQAATPVLERASALDRLPGWQRSAVLAVGEAVRRGLTLRSGGRYRIGPGLVTNGRLHLRGPGIIAVGRDVNAWVRAEANRLETKSATASIAIGDRVRLNGADIQAVAGISIGDDCILGSCTLVDTDYHGVEPSSRGRPSARPITVGRNVWIGGSVVLKGVSVGDNSVIGLGSVVTEDVPPDVLVAGNPARVVRPLSG